MWRTVRLAAAVVIVVGGLAACEPPPPIVIEVNSLAATRDANPGDGVCETAPGNGECTAAAAIDEGNAAGRAVIHVPDSRLGQSERVPDPMSISGHLTLVAEGFQSVPNAYFADLLVEPGATLRMDSVLVAAERLQVEGTLLVDRSGLFADTTVAASGRMLVLNSNLLGFSHSSGPVPVVENHGLFWMRFSLIGKNTAVLHTAPGATSRIGASSVLVDDIACTGEPVESEGYNEGGAGCLNDPTDSLWGSNSIPVGAVGCGTDVTVDLWGNARPGAEDPEFGLGCTTGTEEL